MPHSLTRTCPRCYGRYPADGANFYQRGNGRLEYCLHGTVHNDYADGGCHGSYWRNVAIARREKRASMAGQENLVGEQRGFGVEIETAHIDRLSVIHAMRGEGLDVTGRYSADHTHWYGKSEHCGSEYVSPILRGQDGFEQVVKACRALRSQGAGVRSDCGLHVHHDVRDLTIDQFKTLFKLWHKNEQVIELMVSASRRNGQWSRRLDPRVIESIDACQSLSAVSRGVAYVGRYRSLNVAAYAAHGTVEVRLHQGSHDAKKINAWVQFGQAMIELAKATRGEVPEYQELSHLLNDLQHRGNLHTDTKTYLLHRAEVLGRPTRQAREMEAWAARRRAQLA